MDLECKFSIFDSALSLTSDAMIEGYASHFGRADQGGDIVCKGAYSVSLAALKREGRAVKMLWQHDPAQPIGVWDEVREDDKGLWVKGRLLDTIGKGREAAALIAAGAIDGLSIGYRTKRAVKNDKGQRVLTELELWEVSLVTFPMLTSARVGAKTDSLIAQDMRDMAAALRAAQKDMARP
ncbi:HK97 family phage prohead protease [Thalassovita sp.]|uniref:HK97 family phage prohead protease n=1 Tax=Thalassovita sp. TaxID=1979401 RepID=UPI002B27BB73|nr:HK97 family phage prohead protease [Thalassovita sp.]